MSSSETQSILFRFIIICWIAMQFSHNRIYDNSKNFRIKSFRFENLTTKTKSLSNSKNILPNRLSQHPLKPKRRVATEMTQKYLIQDQLRLSSSNNLQAQQLKEQLYLINLCKKLQNTTFKLKNVPLDYPFRQNSIRIYKTPKKANQKDKKSMKKGREAHKSFRYHTQIAKNERQTLKNRMKALQTTQPTFFI